jgi:hypothetical protein
MTTLQQAHGRDASYWGDRGEWIIAYTKTRDADILDRANWESFLERLADANADDWTIETSGHWAVGHIDFLIVKPDTDAATIAKTARAELDEYPVLDDELHSRMEYDSAIESCLDAVRQKFGRDVPEDAADYVYQHCEESGRDVGYYGADDFWPDDRSIVFGYLNYRRAAKRSQTATN